MLLGGLCFSERRGTRVDLGKVEGEGRGLGEGKGQTVLYVRKINKIGRASCREIREHPMSFSRHTHTHTHAHTNTHT